MANEQLVRERVEGILKIERAIEQGEDGLAEVCKLHEQGVTGEDIVRMLKENARNVVLVAFIKIYCG